MINGVKSEVSNSQILSPSYFFCSLNSSIFLILSLILILLYHLSIRICSCVGIRCNPPPTAIRPQTCCNLPPEMLLQQTLVSSEAVKLSLLRKASMISNRTSDRKVNSAAKEGLLDVIFGRPSHVGKVDKILFKELMG